MNEPPEDFQSYKEATTGEIKELAQALALLLDTWPWCAQAGTGAVWFWRNGGSPDASFEDSTAAQATVTIVNDALKKARDAS